MQRDDKAIALFLAAIARDPQPAIVVPSSMRLRYSARHGARSVDGLDGPVRVQRDARRCGLHVR